MRTFFARRYMRPLDWVSGREKALGLCLLLLLVGIVAAFVYHTTTNKDYLFETSSAALEHVEPTRAAFVAAELLPDLGDPAWQALAPPQVLTPTALPNALAGLDKPLADLGEVGIYVRSYAEKSAADAVITAAVCETGAPEQALGLAAARRPTDAKTAGLGRGGWIAADESRAGFWSGKLYTELHATAWRNDQALTMSRVAQQFADIQLPYGGPFWAESVLAPAGAQADTFRYIHAGAFGIDALQRVFAIDGAEGVTAWALDAGSPAAAMRLFRDLEAGAAPGSVAHKDAVTALTRDDGALAYFTMGSRVQGAWAPQRDAALHEALNAYQAAASAAGFAAASAAGVPAATGTDSPFPEAALDDWTPPTEVSRFTAETLYQKINGRADAYLQFDVVGMIFGTYARRSDAAQTVDVYWYDMGEGANAYGIYQAEASPGATAVDIGRAGYQVDGAVFFVKGGAYVQVLPADPADGEVALAVASQIAATIAEEAEDQWADGVLPPDGRTSDELVYLAKDVFDLEFLSDVYTAEYTIDGVSVTLFVHRAPDAATAESLWNAYVASFADFGEVTHRDEARRLVAGDVAGLVDVVFAKGRYLAGVAGAENADAALAAATRFFDRIDTD